MTKKAENIKASEVMNEGLKKPASGGIRKPKDIDESTPWQEMTLGGEIAGPATSVDTMTGQWRSNRPLYFAQNCKQCLLCAPFCPDSSIPVHDGRREDFDYDHCKGCGICFKICPFNAIGFVKEGEQI